MGTLVASTPHQDNFSNIEHFIPSSAEIALF